MISLRNVRFGYTNTAPAFACDAIDVGPGITLLLGPNGAGKSTFLKLAAGVEHPHRGTIAIDGHDLWRDEVAARSALTYVPEHPDLTPYATVGEVLGLVCRLRQRPIDEAQRALATVGLGGLDSRSIRELSMGQRRRAVLAAAFIGEPNTLLLDEPLETMDRAMRTWLTSWITGAGARGATVIVATHDVEPFADIAQRALVVTAGAPRLIEALPNAGVDRLALLDRLARGHDDPAVTAPLG